MRGRLITSLLVVALLSAAGLAAGKVAVVRSVDGTATADGKPLKKYTPLAQGATLNLAAGAVVTVDYLSGGRRETITGPGEVKVGSGASQGSAKVVAAEGSGKSSLPDRKNSKLMGGAAQRAVDLCLLGPGAFTGPVTFEWKALPSVPGPYMVTVYSDHFVNQLWVVDGVQDHKVVYDGPELEKDRTYYVEVSAGDPESVLGATTAQGRFRILSPDTSELLEVSAQELRSVAKQNSDPAPLLLLLGIYHEHDALNQAVQAGVDALAYQSSLSPEDKAELHEWLGALYQELGDYEKAGQHRKLAIGG